MDSKNEHKKENVIGTREIINAGEILKEYKTAKSSLEQRIIEEEMWWKLRHWEVLRRKQQTDRGYQPTSAWLFNALINKHADAMDNYPEPVCLPREQKDNEDALMLSSILPVILNQNQFEQTYSDNIWYKLKHGVCGYGVFWNNDKENGLGDVDIKKIDILNVFWQPGITDIQNSANIFIVDLVDRDALTSAYPHIKNKLITSNDRIIELGDYIYDDSINTDNKLLVVDWYYKKRVNGRTVLHFCKFVGDILLYASENDPLMENGWYEHGLYPVVFDVLYPVEGTPFGFGVISVTKDPQSYIDKMDRNIMENMDWATRVRYFGKKSMGINEKDFLDLDKQIVEVEGDISEERLRPISVAVLPDVYLTIKQQKIEELKETSANRDFSQGSVTGGVTAASAIASLQEAGNKTSRDMIASSNRSFVKIVSQVIELIRQFYTEKRCFRITGESASGYRFVNYSSEGIAERLEGCDLYGNPIYRRPIFDIDVKARKRNPFSRLSQNELAEELYAMGVFDEGNEEKGLALLDIMDFDGIEKVRENLRASLNKKSELYNQWSR